MNETQLKRGNEIQKQIESKKSTIEVIDNEIVSHTVSAKNKGKCGGAPLVSICLMTGIRSGFLEFRSIDPISALKKEKEAIEKEIKELEKEFSKL